MDYRINVTWQASAPDGRAEGILSDVRALIGPGLGSAGSDLGSDLIQSVQVSDLYFLRGDLTPTQVETLCHELLVDPIVQGYQVSELSSTQEPPPLPSCTRIQVTYHPGVTDSIAENLILGAERLGIDVQRAATGTAYTLVGDLDVETAHRIASGLLCNSVIQDYVLIQAGAVSEAAATPFVALAPPNDVA